MTIELNQPEGSNFGPQVIELLRIIQAIETDTTDREIIFDFSRITFVRPLFILTLAGLIYKLRRDGKTVNCINNSHDYLNLIYFYEGLKPDNHSDWKSLLSTYAAKNYVPILNFPTSKNAEAVQIRNNSLSCLNGIIRQKLNLDANSYNAISYLISEMTDNISDHSGEDRGWLFAQYYPEGRFIDICILDTGKTILNSYHDNGFDEIESQTEAIQRATEGLSTKSSERGRGIPTTRKLIVTGMQGKFGLVSGNAILQNERITELPASWPGTFLALRVPQNPQNFNFYDFIE